MPVVVLRTKQASRLPMEVERPSAHPAAHTSSLLGETPLFPPPKHLPPSFVLCRSPIFQPSRGSTSSKKSLLFQMQKTRFGVSRHL